MSNYDAFLEQSELQFLRAENARLKNSLTELERHLIDARGEIDRMRLSK